MSAGRGLNFGGGGSGSGTVTSVNSGTGITVDNTNPAAPIVSVASPSDTIYYYTDFLVGNTAQDGWISNLNSGVGTTTFQIGAIGNKMGVRRMETGTTPTGSSSLRSDLNSIEPGHGTLLFEALVQIPTISDGTETFDVRVGLQDTAASVTSDGVVFRYTHSVNSGKFEAVTMKATVETAQDTLQAVVAGTWYKLRVQLNAAATSATFYINDILTNTIATNLPDTSANLFGFGAGIFKSVGITPAYLYVDYYKFISVLTVPR